MDRDFNQCRTLCEKVDCAAMYFDHNQFVCQLGEVNDNYPVDVNLGLRVFHDPNKSPAKGIQRKYFETELSYHLSNSSPAHHLQLFVRPR